MTGFDANFLAQRAMLSLQGGSAVPGQKTGFLLPPYMVRQGARDALGPNPNVSSAWACSNAQQFGLTDNPMHGGTHSLSSETSREASSLPAINHRRLG